MIQLELVMVKQDKQWLLLTEIKTEDVAKYNFSKYLKV
jgi:hypothetical protein